MQESQGAKREKERQSERERETTRRITGVRPSAKHCTHLTRSHITTLYHDPPLKSLLRVLLPCGFKSSHDENPPLRTTEKAWHHKPKTAVRNAPSGPGGVHCSLQSGLSDVGHGRLSRKASLRSALPHSMRAVSSCCYLW